MIGLRSRHSTRTRRTAKQATFERLEPRLILSADLTYAFALDSTVYCSALAVAADSAGDVYVAGTLSGTVDFDPGPATFNLTNTGAPDTFLAKYAPDGSLLWAGQVEGPTSGPMPDIGGLAVGNDGAVYMTGAYSGTTDFDLGPGVSSLTSGNARSAFVTKYSSDGALTWAKSLGGGMAEVTGTSIAVDASGNVYTTGNMTQGTADLDPGPGTVIANSPGIYREIYISKLDGSGNSVWVGQFVAQPATGDSPPTTIYAPSLGSADISVDADQNIYLTGGFYGTVDFDPGPGTLLRTGGFFRSSAGLNEGSDDGFVAKFTPAGGVSYVVSMDAPESQDSARSVAVDARGNAYVSGSFTGTMTILAPDGSLAGSLTSAGLRDASVMKLDPSGQLLWAESLGSTDNDDPAGIALRGSEVDVAGEYRGTVDFDPGPGTAFMSSGILPHPPDTKPSYDGFVLQLGTDGEFLSAEDIGAQSSLGSGPATDPQGGLALVGDFRGAKDIISGSATDELTNAGQNDGFVLKINPSQMVFAPAPTASDDSFSTSTDTSLPIPASALLANDTNPNNGPFVPFVLTGPAHGSLIRNADGSFTYTPVTNFDGTDSFTYQARAGWAYSNIARVTINVQPTSDAPLAVGDSYVATVGDTLSVDAAHGVLADDSDPDGDHLTASLVSPPMGGSLIFNSDGSFTYTPEPRYSGYDSFTYRANDGQLDSNTVAVSLIVNAPPQAETQHVYLAPWGLTKVTIDSQDSAPLTRLNLLVTSLPSHGTLFHTGANGPVPVQLGQVFDGYVTTFTYQASGTLGDDSFQFLVTDGYGASFAGRQSITITTPPVPAPKTVALLAGETAHISLDATDDSTPEPELLFRVTSLPAFGILYLGTTPVQVGDTFTGSPSFTYRASHHLGSDSFLYTVSDVLNAPVTGRVSLTVKDTNAHRASQQGDYDGDGKADIMVYRPETATFYVDLSSGGTLVQPWGWIGHDQPVIGDFDGDGKTDFAVFRADDPNNGHASVFYVLSSATGQTVIQPFGSPVLHDQPLTGDFDGDGKTDFAVFRADDPNYGHASVFYVLDSSNGQTTDQPWGSPSLHDQPVIGDFDGDGKTDIAVFRPDDSNYGHNSVFYVLDSSTGQTTIQPWGSPSFHDQPVVGDFDGDGTTDFAVFRPGTATYYIKESSSGETVVQPSGWIGGDQPLTGDYDGDGETDFAAFRPDDATFHIRDSSVGQDTTQAWGWIGHDRPVLANPSGTVPDTPPAEMPSSHQVRTLSVATAQKVEDMLDRHGLGDI